MEPVVIAYLVGFSAVYLVTVAVIMNFATRWRKKMTQAQHDARTKSVRRLVRLNEATADVHDALAYQKRTNEAARARIRRAEREARDNAAQADRNSEMLAESREANARLASKYVAGTQMLGEQAQIISRSADRARQQSFSRARENTRLLRDLEREIESVYKGAVTPQEVDAEVRRLEGELKEHQRENQQASARFYAQVDDLLAASERAQLETGAEIATLYATKEEAELQAGELMQGVEDARAELEELYGAAVDTAEDVEAQCGLRNSQDLDADTLENIRLSYDDILAKLADYTRIIDENQDSWTGLDSRLQEVEGQTAAALEQAAVQNDAVDQALSDLDDYIKSNCTSSESVSELRDEIGDAARRAEELQDDLRDTRVTCEGATETCQQARDECDTARGTAAVNLRDGGVITVEGAGELTLSEGTLRFCSLDDVCHNLASPV